MKRGGPLKRGKGLARKAPLRAQGAPLARGSGLSRGKPLAKRSETSSGRGRVRRARTSPEARAEALARTKGRCAMPGCRRAAAHCHHVLPKGAGEWPELADVVANLLGLCQRCHLDHENAARRVPRRVLPPEAIALAERVGALWFIDRHYPAG